MEVREVLSESHEPPPRDKPWLDGERDVELGEPEKWYVFVETLINDKSVLHPWTIGKEDVFQVSCRCMGLGLGFWG